MFPNIWFNRVNISAILSPYLILSICTSRHRFHLTLISLFLLYGLAENTWQFNSAKTIFAFSSPPQLRRRANCVCHVVDHT